MINGFERFENRFRKAIDYWGDAAFSQTYRERAMYRSRDLSPAEMNELMDLLMDNCERAPSIVKVVSFASIIRNKRQKFTTSTHLVTRCNSCEGDGYFTAIKIWEGREYAFAFRCPDEYCAAANSNISPNCTRWSEEFRGEYIPRNEYLKKSTNVTRDVTEGVRCLEAMGLKPPNENEINP